MARRDSQEPEVYKNIEDPEDFTGGPLPGSPEAGFPPYVDPGVDHAAKAYAAGAAARLAQRKRAAAPKANLPVGGGAPPPIPHLGGQAQEGMTMAEQAESQQYEALRNAQQQINMGVVPTAGGESIVEPHAQTSPFPAAARASVQAQPKVDARSMGIQPGDVLPQEATQDPQFNNGFGSMTAASQPHLAAKYGVVRKGRLIPPQALNPNQKQKLSQETVQGLIDLQRAQEQAAARESSGLPQTEEEAMRGMPSAARQAAKVGDPDGRVENKPLTDDEKRKLAEDIDKLDSLDLDRIQQRMMRDVLQNEKQKRIIEARLRPMTIDELILHNRVKQRVPIIPGKFEPTFQSVSGLEDLALKRLIQEEAQTVEVSDRYLIDKYSMMGIALGLHSINNTPLGNHEDKDGNFSDELFMKKFSKVVRLPTHMLASLGAHYFWFEQRVRALFVMEKVGNG